MIRRTLRRSNSIDIKGAPTEFRIIKAGEFMTDYGKSVCNDKDAQAIIAEFKKRGLDMVIDYAHMSLGEAPPECHVAAGWIQWPNGLEWRPGDGLYAVDVQWTQKAKAGLEASPPEWKYFSPTYFQHEDTGEIYSLVNVALTNNPATWGLVRLAASRLMQSRKAQIMDQNDLKLAGFCLLALMALSEQGVDSNLKGWATDQLKALQTALGDNAQAALDAASATSGDEGSSEGVAAGSNAQAPAADDKDKQMSKSITLAQAIAIQNGEAAKAGEARAKAIAANRHLIPESVMGFVQACTDEEFGKFISACKPLPQAAAQKAAGSGVPRQTNAPVSLPQGVSMKAVESMARKCSIKDPKKVLAVLASVTKNGAESGE